MFVFGDFVRRDFAGYDFGKYGHGCFFKWLSYKTTVEWTMDGYWLWAIRAEMDAFL